MASFVKLFKRKTSKQCFSDHFDAIEVPSNLAVNVMQDDKQLRASSLRTKRKSQAHRKETNAGYMESTKKGMEYNLYKSPYSVLTEPKKSCSTRSCPVGPLDRKETDYRIRNFRKFSPPFAVRTTIHERSGSYENLTTSQLKQLLGEEQSEREKAKRGSDGGAERRKENAEGRRKETKPKKPGEDGDGMTAQHGTNDCLAKRCHGLHSTTHYSHHHNSSQQPLSTSEYWSSEPSPIGEDQPHSHLRISHNQRSSACGFREEMMMELVGLGMEKDDESSSEDGDSSSDDDNEISKTALLQFWQQQVRMLKCELKSSKETAEKYRGKYLRLKTKTDKLSSELARERERNIWLFHQLIAANDKMNQLNWTQWHFRNTQRQHNLLAMNSAEIVANAASSAEKCEINAHHRSTAGEVQAELSSDDFEEKSTAAIRGIEIDREDRQQMIGQRQKQSIRTPTPIPLESVKDFNSGLPTSNFFYAPATFVNSNSLHNAQHIHNQLQVEVARGGLLSGSCYSNSRLISPPTKKGETKADKDHSPMAIEKDLYRLEEGGSECMSETDSEEHGPIVIPLDIFCHQQINRESKGSMRESKESLEGRSTISAKMLLRHSRSSEDLRSPEKREVIGGLTMGSSSEDDLRMWKKQLRSRGDRVLFRPSRKSLFPGIIVKDEKGPSKIFCRFGQPEREALAKFDYLRDERSDLSGLMSSPEKMPENTKLNN